MASYTRPGPRGTGSAAARSTGKARRYLFARRGAWAPRSRDADDAGEDVVLHYRSRRHDAAALMSS